MRLGGYISGNVMLIVLTEVIVLEWEKKVFVRMLITRKLLNC